MSENIDYYNTLEHPGTKILELRGDMRQEEESKKAESLLEAYVFEINDEIRTGTLKNLVIYQGKENTFVRKEHIGKLLLLLDLKEKGLFHLCTAGISGKFKEKLEGHHLFEFFTPNYSTLSEALKALEK